MNIHTKCGTEWTHLNCISSHINLPFRGSWPFDSSSTRSFTKHYIIFPFAFVCLHHLTIKTHQIWLFSH
jgi:hypothetical protein